MKPSCTTAPTGVRVPRVQACLHRYESAYAPFAKHSSNVKMVEGNLSVAAGRESRTAIVQGFRDLLMRTRGTAELTTSPNSEKVRRVEEILNNWIARLSGATTEAPAIEMPDTAEEAFDVANEERQKSMAQMRGGNEVGA